MEATHEAAFKRMSMINSMLILAASSLGLVFYFVGQSQPYNEALVQVFAPIVIVVTLMEVGLSFWLFNTQVRKIKAEESLDKKIASYGAAHLVRKALLFGGAIFNAASVLATGESKFMVGFLLCFTVMFLSRPSVSDFLQRVSVSDAERRSLEA
jgi:protein-S-isoprenylcysteine O-methyltransferase Ste14